MFHSFFLIVFVIFGNDVFASSINTCDGSTDVAEDITNTRSQTGMDLTTQPPLRFGYIGLDSQENASSGIGDKGVIIEAEYEYEEEEAVIGSSFEFTRSVASDKFCKVTLGSCLLLSETYDLQDKDVEPKEKDSRIRAYLENILLVTGDTNTINKNKKYIFNSSSVEQKINSLNHPFCYEVFKRVGSRLAKGHTSWLMKNVPEVILENAECLKSLQDFSFINTKVLRKMIPAHFASTHVDLLQIPKFWETALEHVLMEVLVREYDRVVHEEMLRSNIERIKSISDLLENPLYYPFISQIPGEILKIPSDYEANPRFIIAYIRNEEYGLDKRILLSLVSYVQLTNRIIASSMNDISQKWVYLHRTKEYAFPTPMSVRNEVFKQQTQKFFSTLRYLIRAREEVNDLLSDLEKDVTFRLKLRDDEEKRCFIESLNIICQTAFDLVTRKSFEMRNNFVFYIKKKNDSKLLLAEPETMFVRIHPANHESGVNLPTPRSEYYFGEACIDHRLRSALWVNILGYEDAKGKAFTCYKDKYFGIRVNDILDSWENLFDEIGGFFTSDQLSLNFLNDVLSLAYTEKVDDEPLIARREEIRERSAEPVLSLLKKLGNEHILSVTDNLLFLWSKNEEILDILSYLSLETRRGVNGFRSKILDDYHMECCFREELTKYFQLSGKCFEDSSLAFRPVNSVGNQEIIEEFHSNCSEVFTLMRQINTIFTMFGDYISIDELYGNELLRSVLSTSGNGNSRFLTSVQIQNHYNAIKRIGGDISESNHNNIATLPENRDIYERHVSFFTADEIVVEEGTIVISGAGDNLDFDYDIVVTEVKEEASIEDHKGVVSVDSVEVSVSDVVIESDESNILNEEQDGFKIEIQEDIVEPFTITESVSENLVDNIIVSATDDLTCTVSKSSLDLKATPSADTDMYDPILLKERSDKISKIETKLLSRFSSSLQGYQGSVLERLTGDNIFINESEYCGMTFALCLYLNDSRILPEHDAISQQRFILQSITSMLITERYIKTLSHPMCFDAFKGVGNSITRSQIQWFTYNAPFLIFDNIELLNTLQDFSFYTMTVHKHVVNKFAASSMVDLLALEAFWRTAPIEYLLACLGNKYIHSVHWEMMQKYRPIEDIISLPGFFECPYFYSVFAQITELPVIDVPFLVGSGERIVGAIRSDGVSAVLLENLLVFTLKTNEIMSYHMKMISFIWAGLNDDSFLEKGTFETGTRNRIYNVSIEDSMYILYQINHQREKVNDLIREVEEKKIQIHAQVSQKVPKVLDFMKVIIQTPFDFRMRLGMKGRADFVLNDVIDPEEQSNNVVPLPRVSREKYEKWCENKKDLNFIMNQDFCISLWRNVFFPQVPGVGVIEEESDRQQKDQNGQTLHQKYETIYRNNKKISIHILDSWMGLGGEIISHRFRSGDFFISLLLEISDIPQHDGSTRIERKLLAGKMVEAVKLIDSAYLNEEIICRLKMLWSDFEDVLSELNRKVADFKKLKSAKNRTYFRKAVTISALVEPCKSVISYFKNVFTNLRSVSPSLKQKLESGLFSSLRNLETFFKGLGAELTEKQIKQIRENEVIMDTLQIHSRAITKSQVAGLLKSESGIKFLRENPKISTGLIDYSAFTSEILEQVGIKFHDIKLNTSTLPSTTILMELVKNRPFDDPIGVAFSVGLYFWNQGNLRLNGNIWQLVNPLTVALDRISNISEHFYDAVSITEMKLRILTVLPNNLKIGFILRWLLEQEWNSFVYLAGLEIISNLPDQEKRTVETKTLTLAHEKFKGEERRGKGEILKWKAEVNEEVEVDEVLDALNNLLSSSAVAADGSESNSVGSKRSHQLNVKLEQFQLKLKTLIQEYCALEATQLIARIDALSLLNALNNTKTKANNIPNFGVLEIRAIFMNLSPWDATLLNILLKKHGITAEENFSVVVEKKWKKKRSKSGGKKKEIYNNTCDEDVEEVELEGVNE